MDAPSADVGLAGSGGTDHARSRGLDRGTLAGIATAFAPLAGARVERVTRLGGGHINDTFRVDAGGAAHVLQRINGHVFPEPRTVAENTLRVAEHVRRQAGGRALVAEQFLSRAGAPWHEDATGGTWRLMAFVAGNSLDRVTSAAQAAAAGRAFGAFQAAVHTLSPAVLAPVIAGFHDLDARLAAFDAAVAAATRRSGDALARRRLRQASRLHAFVDAMRDSCVRLDALGSPQVIHADCKLANLVFTPSADRVAAIVDLDTVMAGARPTDFADAARSMAARVAEDALGGDGVDPAGAVGSPDDDQVVDVDCLRSLAVGYLEAAGHLLAAPERESLVAATITVAFMLGVRFLTDHLQGDRYFRCARPRQNRDRAATQFRIAAALQRRRAELERVLRAL